MIGSSRTGKIAAAARRDYAEAIAAVMLDPAKQGKIHELASDDAFTLQGMAEAVSAHIGKTIPCHSLPTAEYAKILEGFGLTAGLAYVLADSHGMSPRRALHDDSKTLSKLIDRPTTPMKDTVADALV